MRRFVKAPFAAWGALFGGIVGYDAAVAALRVGSPGAGAANGAGGRFVLTFDDGFAYPRALRGDAAEKVERARYGCTRR